MTDTDTTAAQVQLRLLRAMSPAKRLRLATGWSATIRDLTRARIREEFKGESEAQIRRRFADRWLGEALAEKAYGPRDPHG